MSYHRVEDGPWPIGTTVAAWPAGSVVGGVPQGNPASSAVASANGVVEFGGLTEGATYTAFGHGGMQTFVAINQEARLEAIEEGVALTGPPGPQGPSGPAGPVGSAGPTGPQGPSGQAAGKMFYPAPSVAANIGGYKAMLTSPSAGGEQTIATSCTAVSGDTPIATFVTDPGVPGAVDFPAGTAFRRVYAMVQAGTARLHLQVYKRDQAGVETLARDEYSDPFTNQTVAPQEWSASAPAGGALLATDRLVLKLYGQRITGPTTVTVTTFYEGSAHTSSIQTTISAGAQGPIGPPGPAGGPQGPAGPQGPPGAAGVGSLTGDLMAPLHGNLVSSTSMAVTAFRFYGTRVRAPAAGSVRSVIVFFIGAAGNYVLAVYDCGAAAAGVYTKLGDSGSVASGATGSWKEWTPTAGAIPVTAGQDLMLTVASDNASTTLAKGPDFASSGAAAQLPSGYLSAAGVLPKLSGQRTEGALVAPATITEANMLISSVSIVMFGRVA